MMNAMIFTCKIKFSITNLWSVYFVKTFSIFIFLNLC